ncbi:hypothetical protein EYF80_022210 [Liparis tanakae]|uniref:Uncharacterized protein n=1 Tax=Liparis tanakae TaxID=230148 RepID=A0A4Z2HP35_9TELE|nr:hypothetical protein EYF80_022210 [Liparis tanakae]
MDCYKTVHCDIRIQTDRDFEVSRGSAEIERSRPSVFVKLIYGWRRKRKAGLLRRAGGICGATCSQLKVGPDGITEYEAVGTKARNTFHIPVTDVTSTG